MSDSFYHFLFLVIIFKIGYNYSIYSIYLERKVGGGGEKKKFSEQKLYNVNIQKNLQ